MFTILFPTDFSQPAAYALEYAVALAGKAGARILLFHAVPVPLQDPNTFFKPSEIYSKDESKGKLEALKSQLGARGVPCETVLRVGYSVTEVLDLMEQSVVDLVIIGTRGAGSTPDPLVGSTTAGLIEKSRRPVLVIPAASAFVPLQRIVLAADLKETGPASLEPLTAFARLFRAEILVVNVSKGGQLSEEKSAVALKLEDFLADVPSSMHVMVHDDAAEGLENFVLEKRAQMLALVARKHGFFASLFHDSITRKMTLHAEAPLLVLVEG